MKTKNISYLSIILVIAAAGLMYIGISEGVWLLAIAVILAVWFGKG